MPLLPGDPNTEMKSRCPSAPVRGWIVSPNLADLFPNRNQHYLYNNARDERQHRLLSASRETHTTHIVSGFAERMQGVLTKTLNRLGWKISECTPFWGHVYITHMLMCTESR